MSTDFRKRLNLSFGLGHYQQFFDAMVAALPKATVRNPDGTTAQPLAALSERSLSDPTIALIDAWAAAADIVSFYQDRILNEGYLPSAVERRSLALMGRSLGSAPAAFVGAATELAMFVQTGATAPVTVPSGTAIQAAAADGKSGPVFETSTGLSALLSLNRLTPFQTRPATLAADAEGTIVKGTGLGLSPGDPLLLVSNAADGNSQWVRMAVTRTKENNTLNVTEVYWGRPLKYQWEEAGTGGPVPAGSTGTLTLYVLRLSCRLFGYNAPAWSAQPYAVQLTATPPGHYPSEYTEWPNFGINLDALDLQGLYSKLLPDTGTTPPNSVLLLEDPQNRRLGVVGAVAPVMVAAYGMSGQVSQVTLSGGVIVHPTGHDMEPPRYAHTATQLPDGRVLIVGGLGRDGVVESVEVFDPETQLLSSAPPLPKPRAYHTATVAGNVLYLIGGTDGETLLDDVLQLALDGDSLAFSAVEGARLPNPRVLHQATALPDGRIMVSGGCAGTLDAADVTIPDDETAPKAYAIRVMVDEMVSLASAAIFNPVERTFGPESQMQHPRTSHTAVICPVYNGRWTQTSPQAGPLIGQTVVFIGGYDRAEAGATDITAWADAEVTTPWPAQGSASVAAGELVAQLFAFEQRNSDGTRVRAAGRYDHQATSLPTALGIALTGGATDQGNALADSWAMTCYAYFAPEPDGSQSDFFLGVPGFYQAANPLTTGRWNHVAACLPEGRLLVAGGEADGGTVLDSVESYALALDRTIPVTGADVLGATTTNPPLDQARTESAWTVMPSGKLFVCGGLSCVDPLAFLGSAQLYDPADHTFLPKPGPVLPGNPVAVPLNVLGLNDGTILIVGVEFPPGGGAQPLAWTYDPASNLSTLTSPPTVARMGASVSLLSNSTVLFAGGSTPPNSGASGPPVKTAEIYDPRSRSFHAVYGTMSVARANHSATVLPDGTVLLAGGSTGAGPTATADIFDPLTQTFTPVDTAMPAAVSFPSAASLASGDVLITGGIDAAGSPTATAVVYNFAAQGFAPIGTMTVARAFHSATALSNGKVFIAGGSTDGTAPIAATEIFDPTALAFTAGLPMDSPRAGHGAVLLQTGKVLLIGGDAAGNTAETDDPAGGTLPDPPLPLPITLPPSPVSSGGTNILVQPVTLSEYGIFSFGHVASEASGGVSNGKGGIAAAALYVLPPPPPSVDARRESLVFTQSQPLAFAPPIDVRPVEGSGLVLSGINTDIQPGAGLLATGQPPLAQTVGNVGYVGSDQILPAGTPLLVTAKLASGRTDQEWWSVQTADGRLLTVATDTPAPKQDMETKPQAALLFMSGNGKDIGNIPPATYAKFARPTLGEMVTVRTVTTDADSASTTLALAAPLRFLYDRTTMTLYGNIVEITQGSTVASEVLGSGNGTVPFQTFTLKQAPLTFLADPQGGIAPALTVTVSGVDWLRVLSLSESGPTDRHYQLTVDAQGRAQIMFGDGVHGQRLPTGTNNVVATYRVGAGLDGNVAAGSLTRPPSQVAGISGVLNPLPATGGVGAVPVAGARRMIPLGVQDLGRIVNEADILTFVQNYADVAKATASRSAPPEPGGLPTVLVSVAGPLGAVPDPASDSFRSLVVAVAAAMPRPLPHQVLPYTPRLFKLVATVDIDEDANAEAVKELATNAVKAAYASELMSFGEAVRASDLAMLLNQTPGLKNAQPTALWVPSEETQTFHDMLSPRPATENAGVWYGAEIIAVSDDSDAIQLIVQPTT